MNHISPPSPECFNQLGLSPLTEKSKAQVLRMSSTMLKHRIELLGTDHSLAWVQHLTWDKSQAQRLGECLMENREFGLAKVMGYYAPDPETYWAFLRADDGDRTFYARFVLEVDSVKQELTWKLLDMSLHPASNYELASLDELEQQGQRAMRQTGRDAKHAAQDDDGDDTYWQQYDESGSGQEEEGMKIDAMHGTDKDEEGDYYERYEQEVETAIVSAPQVESHDDVPAAKVQDVVRHLETSITSLYRLSRAAGLSDAHFKRIVDAVVVSSK